MLAAEYKPLLSLGLALAPKDAAQAAAARLAAALLKLQHELLDELMATYFVRPFQETQCLVSVLISHG